MFPFSLSYHTLLLGLTTSESDAIGTIGGGGRPVGAM